MGIAEKGVDQHHIARRVELQQRCKGETAREGVDKIHVGVNGLDDGLLAEALRVDRTAHVMSLL